VECVAPDAGANGTPPSGRGPVSPTYQTCQRRHVAGLRPDQRPRGGPRLDSVLGAGATIASPSAEVLRSGCLPQSAVNWLKSNFFKTELELGHCLRLPQEGPEAEDLPEVRT